MKSIDVLFTPADFQALTADRLKNATCVVFDILRATSSIVTALANGARAVIPVQTIAEALERKRRDPEVLLAGERDGYRISAKLTGGIDFDFGNSPREFTAPAITGKTLVMTTTNGTRALRACVGAQRTLIASFLNLKATLALLGCLELEDLIFVCSGTHEEASFEDTLAAGASVAAIHSRQTRFARVFQVSDSAQIAKLTYETLQADLHSAMRYARNGRRLLDIPELRDDVAFCLQRDTCKITARLEPSGEIVALR